MNPWPSPPNARLTRRFGRGKIILSYSTSIVLQSGGCPRDSNPRKVDKVDTPHPPRVRARRAMNFVNFRGPGNARRHCEHSRTFALFASGVSLLYGAAGASALTRRR